MSRMATRKKQSQLLKRYIRSRRITQGELARLLGVSPSHLSKVMRGDRELGKSRLLDASRLVGVPMESFFQ